MSDLGKALERTANWWRPDSVTTRDAASKWANLASELAEVLEVAIARGEQMGYTDDDYRKRLAVLRAVEEGTQ